MENANFLAIQVGEYELIYSTTVISDQNKQIEISLGKSDEKDKLKLLICFEADSNSSDAKVSHQSINQHSLKITLSNIRNFINGGPDSIMRIGELGNRGLYYSFRVFTLEPGGYTIVLNFYLGEL